MNKEYFKKYYKDHKEERDKSVAKWHKDNPEKSKKIKKTYYDRNKEKMLEYSKDYHKKNRDRISESKRKPGEKPARVIGIRMKGPKPFLERISPELLAKIKENTRINDKKIKYFTLDDTENAVLVRNLK